MPSTARQLNDAGVLGSLGLVATALASSLLCILVCAGLLLLADAAEWVRKAGLVVLTVAMAIGQPPIVYSLAKRMRSTLNHGRAISGAILASACTLLLLAVAIAEVL